MNTHLGYAVAHRLNIARISHLESIDPSLDPGPSVKVTKFPNPFGKSLGLPNLDHYQCILLATNVQRPFYASTISTFVSIKCFGFRAGK